MNLMNSLPKRLSWEVSFVPAIAILRYENGCLDTHDATPEFADSFVQKYDFKDFVTSKIYKSLWRSRFLEVPKPSF